MTQKMKRFQVRNLTERKEMRRFLNLTCSFGYWCARSHNSFVRLARAINLNQLLVDESSRCMAAAFQPSLHVR